MINGLGPNHLDIAPSDVIIGVGLMDPENIFNFAVYHLPTTSLPKGWPYL